METVAKKLAAYKSLYWLQTNKKDFFPIIRKKSFLKAHCKSLQIYSPSKSFFKSSSTGLSESQIPKKAFLNSNPGILPSKRSFL